MGVIQITPIDNGSIYIHIPETRNPSLIFGIVCLYVLLGLSELVAGRVAGRVAGSTPAGSGAAAHQGVLPVVLRPGVGYSGD